MSNPHTRTCGIIPLAVQAYRGRRRHARGKRAGGVGFMSYTLWRIPLPPRVSGGEGMKHTFELSYQPAPSTLPETEKLPCPLQRASPCPRLQPVGMDSSSPPVIQRASARLLDSLQRGLNFSLTDNPTEELRCPLQRASPCPRLQPVGYGLFFSSSDPARFSAASRLASPRFLGSSLRSLLQISHLLLILEIPKSLQGGIDSALAVMFFLPAHVPLQRLQVMQTEAHRAKTALPLKRRK